MKKDTELYRTVIHGWRNKGTLKNSYLFALLAFQMRNPIILFEVSSMQINDTKSIFIPNKLLNYSRLVSVVQTNHIQKAGQKAAQ